MTTPNANLSNAEAVKLFIILDSHRYNSTCVFDIACLFTGLKVFYVASSDYTETALNRNKPFMNIFKSKIKPIIHNYKSILTLPFVNKELDLIKNLIKENIDNALLVYPTPYSSTQIGDINNNVLQKSKNWLGSELRIYNDLRHKFSPIELTYQSFIGNFYWQYPFDKDGTKLRYFHISDNNSIQIPTMVRKNKNATLLKYNDYKLNCLFVDIPFKNSENSMLIIKPNQTMPKDGLLNFCKTYLIDGNVISKFYNNVDELTVYKSVYLPKFRIRSQCHLDKNEIFLNSNFEYVNLVNQHCKYLYDLFFMCPSMKYILLNNDIKIYDDDMLRLSSNVELVCNENGITSDAKINLSSRVNNNNIIADESETLRINSNFIFAIMNKNKSIIAMGIFIGENFDNDTISFSPYDIVTIE